MQTSFDLSFLCIWYSACLPERVEGEVLRVASYREIDENDEVALEAETAEVMRNAPHVLVGTAMGLKQFVGFVDSAFPAESVKMVCALFVLLGQQFAAHVVLQYWLVLMLR